MFAGHPRWITEELAFQELGLPQQEPSGERVQEQAADHPLQETLALEGLSRPLPQDIPSRAWEGTGSRPLLAALFPTHHQWKVRERAGQFTHPQDLWPLSQPLLPPDAPARVDWLLEVMGMLEILWWGPREHP